MRVLTASLIISWLCLVESDSVIPDTPPLRLQWYDSDCFGEEYGLLSTGLWLFYTSNYTNPEQGNLQSYSCRVWIDFNSSLPRLEYYEGKGPKNINFVDYELYQPEHGGGTCHCVNVSFADDNSTSSAPTTFPTYRYSLNH